MARSSAPIIEAPQGGGNSVGGATEKAKAYQERLCRENISMPSQERRSRGRCLLCRRKSAGEADGMNLSPIPALTPTPGPLPIPAPILTLRGCKSPAMNELQRASAEKRTAEEP